MAMVSWQLRLKGNAALGRAGLASVTWMGRYALIFGGRVNDEFFFDVWSFDTRVANPQLTCLSSNIEGAGGRAYHTATMVDSTVWILGGSTDKDIFDEAWTFRPDSREWRKVPLRGETHLLKRSAHAACVHPTRPHCVLIFGGYGMLDGKRQPRWLSDLVVVDTLARRVERLTPSGPIPAPRGYHSFTAVGPLCIGLLGRSEEKKLVSVKDAVAVYDALTNAWAIPRVKGDVPTGRSSHRASAVPGGLLMFGGAPGSGKVHRFNEALLLKVNEATGEMAWHRCGSGSSDRKPGGEAVQKEALAVVMPRGRAGHAQEWINGTLHVFGGYANQKVYCQDAWTARLDIEVPPTEESPVTRALAAPARATKAAAPPAAPVAPAPAAGHEWRTAKRRATGGAAGPPPPKAHPDGGGAKRLRALPVTSPKAPLPAKDTPVKAPPRARAPPPGPPSITPPEDVHSTSQREMAPPPPQQQQQQQQVVVDMRELKREWEEGVVQRRKMEALHYQEKKEWLKEREEFRRELKSAKDELKIADRNWKEAGEKVQKLQAAASSAEWRANSAEARMHAAEERVAELTRVKDAVKAQALASKEECARTKSSADQIQTALRAAQKERDELKTDVHGLARTLEEEKRNAGAAAAARDSLQEQNAVLQQRMTTAEREKDKLAEDLAAVRQQLTIARRDLETERARAASEAAEAKRSVAAAEQQAQDTQRRLAAAEQELGKATEERNRLQGKAAELETERSDLDRARRQAEQRVSHLNDDVARLQQQVAALKSRVDQEKAALETSLSGALQQLRRMGGFGAGPSS